MAAPAAVPTTTPKSKRPALKVVGGALISKYCPLCLLYLPVERFAHDGRSREDGLHWCCKAHPEARRRLGPTTLDINGSVRHLRQSERELLFAWSRAAELTQEEQRLLYDRDAPVPEGWTRPERCHALRWARDRLWQEIRTLKAQIVRNYGEGVLRFLESLQPHAIARC